MRILCDSVRPRIIDDREFRRLAGARRSDAVVLIENGYPQIVMRQGASASALREELTHLAQWKTDPMMRRRMASLSEDRLASWKQVPPADKLELHLDKLEIEADAHRLDAGREWRRSTEDLSKIDADLHAGALVGQAEVEARRALANAGMRVRAALQKRIAAGVLDEASAGLIAC